MSLENLDTYLSFAIDVAQNAGKVTMKYFLKDIEVDSKGDETPVTIADKQAEEYVRARVAEKFPEHAILGEEAGESTSDSPYRWVIDPIDGTQSFIRGVPLYTVLLALEYNKVPILGVIHNPPLQETVYAATGLGAFYNGAPCQVSSTETLAKAWVQATDCADLNRRRPEFTRKLLKASYSLRTWGDAYGYLLVATGRVDVMIDPIMSYWDIAPLKPIITEARGVFSDLDGNDNPTGVSSIACNPTLHEEIMKLV
ncbi:MAG: inositol monophosphatase family protein [Candidatus Thorarchaeota archaeon]